IEGMASRALARMKARLKFGWAIDSVAAAKRVPSWAPEAPISRKARMASPRPMPPATKTGTSWMCGRISCASTVRLTGPIWPPASEPSITNASAPERTRRLASTRAGVKAISFAPPSFTARTALPGGMPPASTMWPTFASKHTRARSSSWGCMVIRLTPNGRSVSAWVPAISAASRSGVIEPQAITPKPPALDMAATRWRSLTQVIAPPMMAWRQPRNAVPRTHSASSRARAAASRAVSPEGVMSEGMISAGIEAIGGVQRAHRQFRVFRGNQHADLDLAGGDHLNVDRLVGQRAEHGVGHAGVAAHADPDHADFGDVWIGQQFRVADLRADPV